MNGLSPFSGWGIRFDPWVDGQKLPGDCIRGSTWGESKADGVFGQDRRSARTRNRS